MVTHSVWALERLSNESSRSHSVSTFRISAQAWDSTSVDFVKILNPNSLGTYRRLRYMNRIAGFPLLVLVLSLVVLWLSVRIGGSLRKKRRNVEEESKDFDLIMAAILTLLALLIGFSFSTAANRYDQRKNYEEAEANAIGTEYLRADLLPASDALRVRTLLRNYLEQRLLFYNAGDNRQLQQVDDTTAQLETDLWAVVQYRRNAKRKFAVGWGQVSISRLLGM
jgi:hypothetical protein